MKTNRRNFIKGVTGFIAGIYAAFVPKAIGTRRSGTRILTEEEVVKLKKFNTEDNLKAYIDGRKFKTSPGDYTIAFWVSPDDIGKEKKAHLYSRALSSEEIKKNYNEGII